VPRTPSELPIAEAVALGLLHGPAELVPVSSSGHVAALPWLLGWRTAGASGAARKELEVALHTGTALAMLLVLRSELVMRLTPRRAALLACSFAPPAFVGGVFERAIEERVRGPRWLAFGLGVGALALALCDRAPEERGREDAGWVDGLWLGVAQAAALVPGTSRNGMTLAAARARRFRRPDASELSWRVALPVLVGATALKGARVRGAPERAVPLAAGAAAAFASTLASVRWIGLRRERPLWPWAVERAALAAAVLATSAKRPL
jgi:undecaprenyl-diphosphatase